MNPRSEKVSRFFAEEFARSHSSHCASILEGAETHHVLNLLDSVRQDLAAALILELSPIKITNLLALPSNGVLLRSFEGMSMGKITQVLRLVDENTKEKILDFLSERKRTAVEAMLQHSEMAIAHLVKADVLTLSACATIRDALRAFRRNPKPVEQYLYIVNDRQALEGVCSLKKLFLEKDKDQRLEEVMERKVATLNAEDSIASAVMQSAWKEWSMLPVINRKKQFVGFVRYEMLARFIQETKASEEVPLLIPTSRALGEAFWQALKVISTAVPSSIRDEADSERS